MITKLVKLLGVGTLHEPLPNGALSLRKKTIIFGENGRGKSTFVAILRSLGQGAGTVLRGRSTIGGNHAPSVELLIGPKKHSFQNGAWDQGHEHISIFDATFVAENVYAGTTIDTDQRKNLFSFALGSTGVKLAEKIDSLASILTQDAKNEREAADKVQTHIVGQMSLEVFAELPEPPQSIQTDLAAAKLVLGAQQQSSILKTLESLVPIDFDGPNITSLEKILASSIDSIAKDATARLKQQLQSTGVREEWLIEGFRHCETGVCPFCAQQLSTSQMMSIYEACFSETYREHRERLRADLAAIRKTISAEVEESIKRVVELNASRILAWHQFLPTVSISFDSPQAKETLHNSRAIFDDISSKKMSELAVGVVLDEQESLAIKGISRVVEMVDDYNAQIVSINEQVMALKSSVESPDVSGAQENVNALLNQIARHKPLAEAVVQNWRLCQEKRKHNEQEKVAARTALDKYSVGIPAALIKSVNIHLKGCGAYFKLASLKHVYTGGKPRFEYVIEMRGKAVDLSGKALDGISFSTALSQGDKSTLAFAFFLARLENDATLGDHVVVFDDPLSSLDSCRRRYTRKKIAELASRVSQLILLSHEEATIADVAEMLSETECTLLQFKEKSDFSIIVPTSVTELTASEYVKCFNRMQHFLLGDGTPETVVKDIRPYLEMNLRYRFPEHFRPDPLGKMIAQIRDAVEPSTLFRMKSHLQALNEINDYCTSHSHGDGALENVEKILASDLKKIITLAFEFARGFPVP